MGFRGGVKLTPPPSVSWFSSTPAGIGLKLKRHFGAKCFIDDKMLRFSLEQCRSNSQKYQRFEPLCIKFGNIGVRKFKFEEGVHCSVP